VKGAGMHIIFYLPMQIEATDPIFKVVESISAIASTAVIKTFAGLSRRLHKPFDGPTILILRVSDSKDLMRLLSIRQLLLDFPIILILPEKEYGYIVNGFKLRPRLLTYAEDAPMEITPILKKMIENQNRLSSREGVVS
jgi:hypothetical protein